MAILFSDLPFNSAKAAKCSRIAPPGHKQDATSGQNHNTNGHKYNTQEREYAAHGHKYNAYGNNYNAYGHGVLNRLRM